MKRSEPYSGSSGLEKHHVARGSKKPKRTMVRGEGIYFYDSEGNRYIDGSGGPMVVTIGHGVKEIANAAAKQAEKISYILNFFYASEPALKLAKKIADFTPESMNKIFYVSGGSEGIETAIKMSRQYHLERGNSKKYKVIARRMSYHGNTLGALSASGHVFRRKNYVPLLLDFPHIPPAYCYRCWYNKEYPECDLVCARELERTIKNEGAEHISAFIAEPVVGSALGTVPAPDGYFQIIREICDKYDVLFISDEVMTGFGRTGKNFGIEHWNVLPDMMVCSKGMASGYAALGAVIVKDEIHEVFVESPFIHGFTFGGMPLSCAVGVAVLEYIVKHNLVSRAAEMGERLLNKLKVLYEHPTVGDVRGKGLFAGVEFVKDKKTKEPFDPSVKFSMRLLDKALENSLSIYPGSHFIDGIHGDHIQIAPPFIVTASQVDEIVDIIDKALKEVEDDLGIK